MGEYHGIEGGGVKGERLTVMPFMVRRALDQTTLDYQSLLAHLEPIAGPGNFPGRAVKSQLHG
jgi:hypothetical protein